MDGNVKVAVRVRPLVDRELASDGMQCIDYVPGDNQLSMGPRNVFTYDHVFGTHSRQDDVYNTAVFSLVESFLLGMNSTVLAYGQTGSGKTYTIGSGNTEQQSTLYGLGEHKGIIPRAIDDIFAMIQEKKASTPIYEAEFRVSFLELYQENIRDLLNAGSTTTPTGTSLSIRETETGVMVIGACERRCNTVEEMMAALEEGSRYRTTGATQMNEMSSRSHAILTIFLEQRIPMGIDSDSSKELDEDSSTTANENDGNLQDMGGNGTVPTQEKGNKKNGSKKKGSKKKKAGSDFHKAPVTYEKRISKLNILDLAGSERQKKTQATGRRLQEGININLGLLALANVISALGEEEKRRKGVHVPYRDSKLTYLLRDSLGGNSKTLMIACVSPAQSNFEESLNTLRYAARARYIKNKPRVNRDANAMQIAKLQEEIDRLRGELTREKLSKANTPAESEESRFQKALEDAKSPLTLDHILEITGAATIAELPLRLSWLRSLEKELVKAKEALQRALADLEQQKRNRIVVEEYYLNERSDITELRSKCVVLSDALVEAYQQLTDKEYSKSNMDDDTSTPTNTGNSNRLPVVDNSVAWFRPEVKALLEDTRTLVRRIEKLESESRTRSRSNEVIEALPMLPQVAKSTGKRENDHPKQKEYPSIDDLIPESEILEALANCDDMPSDWNFEDPPNVTSVDTGVLAAATDQAESTPPADEHTPHDLESKTKKPASLLRTAIYNAHHQRQNTMSAIIATLDTDIDMKSELFKALEMKQKELQNLEASLIESEKGREEERAYLLQTIESLENRLVQHGLDAKLSLNRSIQDPHASQGAPSASAMAVSTHDKAVGPVDALEADPNGSRVDSNADSSLANSESAEKPLRRELRAAKNRLRELEARAKEVEMLTRARIRTENEVRRLQSELAELRKAKEAQISELKSEKQRFLEECERRRREINRLRKEKTETEKEKNRQVSIVEKLTVSLQEKTIAAAQAMRKLKESNKLRTQQSDAGETILRTIYSAPEPKHNVSHAAESSLPVATRSAVLGPASSNFIQSTLDPALPIRYATSFEPVSENVPVLPASAINHWASVFLRKDRMRRKLERSLRTSYLDTSDPLMPREDPSVGTNEAPALGASSTTPPLLLSSLGGGVTAPTVSSSVSASMPSAQMMTLQSVIYTCVQREKMERELVSLFRQRETDMKIIDTLHETIERNKKASKRHNGTAEDVRVAAGKGPLTSSEVESLSEIIDFDPTLLDDIAAFFSQDPEQVSTGDGVDNGRNVRKPSNASSGDYRRYESIEHQELDRVRRRVMDQNRRISELLSNPILRQAMSEPNTQRSRFSRFSNSTAKRMHPNGEIKHLLVEKHGASELGSEGASVPNAHEADEGIDRGNGDIRDGKYNPTGVALLDNYAAMETGDATSSFTSSLVHSILHPLDLSVILAPFASTPRDSKSLIHFLFLSLLRTLLQSQNPDSLFSPAFPMPAASLNRQSPLTAFTTDSIVHTRNENKPSRVRSESSSNDVGISASKATTSSTRHSANADISGDSFTSGVLLHRTNSLSGKSAIDAREQSQSSVRSKHLPRTHSMGHKSGSIDTNNASNIRSEKVERTFEIQIQKQLPNASPPSDSVSSIVVAATVCASDPAGALDSASVGTSTQDPKAQPKLRSERSNRVQRPKDFVLVLPTPSASSASAATTDSPSVGATSVSGSEVSTLGVHDTSSQTTDPPQSLPSREPPRPALGQPGKQPSALPPPLHAPQLNANTQPPVLIPASLASYAQKGPISATPPPLPTNVTAGSGANANTGAAPGSASTSGTRDNRGGPRHAQTSKSSLQLESPAVHTPFLHVQGVQGTANRIIRASSVRIGDTSHSKHPYSSAAANVAPPALPFSHAHGPAPSINGMNGLSLQGTSIGGTHLPPPIHMAPHPSSSTTSSVPSSATNTPTRPSARSTASPSVSAAAPASISPMKSLAPKQQPTHVLTNPNRHSAPASNSTNTSTSSDAPSTRTPQKQGTPTMKMSSNTSNGAAAVTITPVTQGIPQGGSNDCATKGEIGANSAGVRTSLVEPTRLFDKDAGEKESTTTAPTRSQLQAGPTTIPQQSVLRNPQNFQSTGLSLPVSDTSSTTIATETGASSSSDPHALLLAGSVPLPHAYIPPATPPMANQSITSKVLSPSGASNSAESPSSDASTGVSKVSPSDPGAEKDDTFAARPVSSADRQTFVAIVGALNDSPGSTTVDPSSPLTASPTAVDDNDIASGKRQANEATSPIPTVHISLFSPTHPSAPYSNAPNVKAVNATATTPPSVAAASKRPECSSPSTSEAIEEPSSFSSSPLHRVGAVIAATAKNWTPPSEGVPQIHPPRSASSPTAPENRRRTRASSLPPQPPIPITLSHGSVTNASAVAIAPTSTTSLQSNTSGSGENPVASDAGFVDLHSMDLFSPPSAQSKHASISSRVLARQSSQSFRSSQPVMSLSASLAAAADDSYTTEAPQPEVLPGRGGHARQDSVLTTPILASQPFPFSKRLIVDAPPNEETSAAGVSTEPRAPSVDIDTRSGGDIQGGDDYGPRLPPRVPLTLPDSPPESPSFSAEEG